MGKMNSDWKGNWELHWICKRRNDRNGICKNISNRYSGEYVYGIGHIEKGSHCQIGLIYFLASSNNSPGIRNTAVSVCGGSVDDEGCSFLVTKL